jgi:hypothetical protein
MITRYGIFIMALVIISKGISAQNFYNTSGTVVSISTNSTISVVDSLINNGTLINNGNLVVGGAWRNLGTYDAGSGQITFNSTDTSIPQIINHNNQAFSKLVISGGGLKRILADITITESLTLTQGIITAENGSKILFEPTAVVSGGSHQAHINAPVYQQGSGTKFFPVGNGIQYLPVEITGITGATTEVGITLTELASGETLNRGSSLSDISNKRYWKVDVAAGSLADTKIILPVEGDEGFETDDLTRLVVARADTETDDFMSLGRGLNSTNALLESELSPTSGVVTLAFLSENQSIVVFNAISPSGSADQNDYVHIDNIGLEDVFSVYNRWGDVVFEMKGYENNDPQKRFNGTANVKGNKELPSGTYFYVIRRKQGDPINGYISLRR